MTSINNDKDLNSEEVSSGKDDKTLKTIILHYFESLKNKSSKIKHLYITFCSILSFIVGVFFTNFLLSFNYKKQSKITNKLQLKLNQRNNELQQVTERLTNEIQLSRAAAQHNTKLLKEKDYFERLYQIQLRNVNELNSQLENQNEIIIDSREKIVQLENEINNKENELNHLQTEMNEQKVKIEQISNEIALLKSQLEKKETELESNKLKINTLKETQRIFEYVLSKTSPQLASRIINQIHRTNKDTPLT
ncbi:hypothetical protein ABK040_009159 [Willaertia magna]